MADIVQGETYRSCQNVITGRKSHNCVECESRGYCDTSPMHEHGSVTSDADGGRCVVTRGTIRGIEAELVNAGIDSAVIADWAREHTTLSATREY